MSTIREDRTAAYLISVVDEDPLRARREARELLEQISATSPGAALDVPQSRAPSDESLKGGDITDLIGLLFNGGALVGAALQVWLARVPQRTVIVSRPDGATLTITGRQAREDDERIERFLADGNEGRQDPADGAGDGTSPAAG
ncbi:hypothetical protein [Streptomyces sp. ISL-43]|uniref:effector-associated constant component EACC1 n=1 Tax=Streptomyces sp. ISL-43 TaxID=2819183 RepID=UPI0027E54BA1|nr:hypothetical protein [Streptomyces sp. ISL-43]